MHLSSKDNSQPVGLRNFRSQVSSATAGFPGTGRKLPLINWGLGSINKLTKRRSPGCNRLSLGGETRKNRDRGIAAEGIFKSDNNRPGERGLVRSAPRAMRKAYAQRREERPQRRTEARGCAGSLVPRVKALPDQSVLKPAEN